MGEVLAALILILFVIFGGSATLAYLQKQAKRAGLIANTPPSAGITFEDDLATMQAKARSNHQIVEAVRILGEIKRVDSLTPILAQELRDQLDAYLADYYANN